MVSTNKNLSLLLIIILATSSLTVTFATLPFGLAQTGTNVTGIIASDTTWTQANSPYTLTGPVAVNRGVTLTIEPGASVYGGVSYYIQVNGTLIAVGTGSNPIILNVQIHFTSVSNSWNQQTGTGSIIENTLYPNVTITGCSPKIDSNTLYGLQIQQASPTISDNKIGWEILLSQSSAIIVNNSISQGIEVSMGAPSILNNTVTSSYDESTNDAAIVITGGSPVIADNMIKSRIDTEFATMFTPSHQIVYPGIVVGANNALISGNVIDDCLTGITLLGQAVTIQNNFINDSQTEGIDITGGNAIIQNNTITYNQVGINSPSSSSVIAYNNIYGNGYNVYLSSPSNVDATNNWWGTTDPQAINQTIYDFKDNFNLGSVNFVPFLAEPNSQAAPDPNAPTPTPISSTSPTPTVPEFPTIVILPLLFLVLFVAAALSHRKKQFSAPKT